MNEEQKYKKFHIENHVFEEVIAEVCSEISSHIPQPEWKGTIKLKWEDTDRDRSTSIFGNNLEFISVCIADGVSEVIYDSEARLWTVDTGLASTKTMNLIEGKFSQRGLLVPDELQLIVIAVKTHIEALSKGDGIDENGFSTCGYELVYA